MKFLEFEQIKAQLRLDDEQAQEEHDLLEMYGEAAEETVLNYIGLTFDELKAKYNNTVPKPIVQAALMLVDTSYQYRSPITPGNVSLVPYTFDLLLKPYVKL